MVIDKFVYFRFEEYFKKILADMDEGRPIVIDNASYHTRQTEESRSPTTGWRVGDIKTWLDNKGKQRNFQYM